MPATLEFQSVRRRNLCWSFVALLLVPTLAQMCSEFARVFYWQMWGWRFISACLLWALPGIIGGVFMTQLVVWWQWPRENKRRWVLAMGLLLAYSIGGLIGALWQGRDDAIAAGPRAMISIGHSLCSVTTHWLALLVIGSVRTFELIDLRSESEPVESEPAKSVTKTQPRSPAQTGRHPLSISVMMFATLVFALMFTLLRYSREIYSSSNLIKFSPPRSLGGENLIRLL
ncbi:MAG: hypothetical protein AAF745_13165, partial [Planctomycetota bacterium]